jgi:hypothetical protein
VGSGILEGNGRIAVGGDAREAVKLFDTETHEELLNLTATGSQFGSIAFAQDGNILGARDQNGEVNLWRAPSSAEITAVEQPEQSTSDHTDVRQTDRESDADFTVSHRLRLRPGQHEETHTAQTNQSLPDQ